jgi:DNA-binding IclR family transcriptional regulator
MGETKCTEAELLEAILAATEGQGEEGLTGPEIARATGLSIDTVRARLATLKRDDKVEVVRVKRTMLNDIAQHFYGYRVKNH